MGVSAVRRNWDRLSGLPGGKRLFSFLIGRMAPYSGTIGARVLELGPGHSRIELRDRRAVRNHLRSVHAIALLNVAELSSGLALTYAMPATARGILTALSMEYLKKARGRLVAACDFALPDWTAAGEHDVVSEVRDAAGDVVARAKARWLVGPVEERKREPAAVGGGATP